MIDSPPAHAVPPTALPRAALELDAERRRVRRDEPVALGLRENWPQFTLLVLINGFVGGMVGIERAVLPLLAESEFGLAARAAILSFIASFGLVKAASNYVAGRQFDRLGRKRVLVSGWIAALPVPLMLFYAPSWSWVIAANVLLGLNQGLCWSATVVMKIDLVGPRRRGLAMGLNEFAGYAAVAIAAWGAAVTAATYGSRWALLAIGLTLAFAGLVLSVAFARDTRTFVSAEAREVPRRAPRPRGNLFVANQAGLVNNLNDGVAWGLFPLLFASAGLGLTEVGLLAAIYPAVWAITQIATGALSDRWGRKWMIAAGLWVQAVAIVVTAMGDWWGVASGVWLGASVLLGIGTALVYPTLLAAVSDATRPDERAAAVGTYRLWRDLGYPVGAILSGFAADVLGLRTAIALAGVATFLSGLVVARRMVEE